MADNTAIEWCDHTFNPWEGCQRVGPGCDHCYAETRNARYGGGTAPNWGPGAPRRRTSVSNWRKPLRWQREAAAFMDKHGRRQRVFCASLADVFDNAVDPAWRADLFELIRAMPDLDWLLLTKRIGNVATMLPVPFDFAARYPNVWIGATIVNQVEADRDIPKLLAIDAAVRFLSMEPLLGPVDLGQIDLRRFGERPTDLSNRLGDYVQPLVGNFTDSPRINWVIVGGESGGGARPMHPDWARSLRDQCAKAGVPFLFKQWGEWVEIDGPKTTGGGPCRRQMRGDHVAYVTQQGEVVGKDHSDYSRQTVWRDYLMARVGKKVAGRLLDDVTHDDFPQ